MRNRPAVRSGPTRKDSGRAEAGRRPGPTTESLPQTSARPTLRRGSRGEDVRFLQQRLKELGHDPGPIDGVFGSRTEQAVKDFYLHNILIHELGHLLDDRNSRSADRERFAEHFALRHGFRPLLQRRLAARDVVRRHHRK